jgi:hypothetical protein
VEPWDTPQGDAVDSRLAQQPARTVGGAGGYAYGSKVAAKKKGYASDEERLRSMISEARSERQSAESYNASLRRVISQQRSEISRIASARKSGQNVLSRRWQGRQEHQREL